MSSVASVRPAGVSRASAPAMIPVASFAMWLSAGLAATAATAAACTLFVPGVLRGVPVMNGSARGTALVMLAIAVPTLIVAMVLTARGSVRAPLVWLGAAAYLLYNAQLMIYTTPLNQLFLVYVATAACALWSVIALLRTMPVTEIAEHASVRLPARTIGAYLVVIAVANAALWVKSVLPDVLSTGPARILAGTGLTVMTTYVQDLVIWLPAAALAGVLLYLRRPWGVVLAGGGLVFWLIEAIGVATDQWFGSTADPASPVASMAAVPIFSGLAVTTAVAVFLFFRCVRPAPHK